jgi:hypothetical protein
VVRLLVGEDGPGLHRLARALPDERHGGLLGRAEARVGQLGREAQLARLLEPALRVARAAVRIQSAVDDPPLVVEGERSSVPLCRRSVGYR